VERKVRAVMNVRRDAVGDVMEHYIKLCASGAGEAGE
jgi:hypothetical protein